MKKFTTALLLGAALLGAADKKDAKKPANQPADVVIPAGAQETEDGSFRFTDAQGKKWIYRKTPFGIAKVAEKPADAASEQQGGTGTNVKACQPGDSSPAGTVVDGYRKVLEATPFGTACRWLKD